MNWSKPNASVSVYTVQTSPTRANLGYYAPCATASVSCTSSALTPSDCTWNMNLIPSGQCGTAQYNPSQNEATAAYMNEHVVNVVGTDVARRFEVR